jgi:hypothetical protein
VECGAYILDVMDQRRTFLQTYERCTAILVICLCIGSVGVTFGQQEYPATKPGDFGYIAEDPQLERLIGMPGPSTRLRAIDGDTIDIAYNYGRKPIYLKLWATYCIPCLAQMPAFEKIYETFRDRMQIVAIDAGVSDDAVKVSRVRGHSEDAHASRD